MTTDTHASQCEVTVLQEGYAFTTESGKALRDPNWCKILPGWNVI